MKPTHLTFTWKGTFIELCMGRVTQTQKRHIDARCSDLDGHVQALWYENAELLKTLFDADNWWSVDDVDHAMGLLFPDRSSLKASLATATIAIDALPMTMDPDAPQLNFYAPEGIEALETDDLVVCHGAHRQATLRLEANFEAPFDLSLITLSCLHYPDYGHILIDIDYDGYDDIHFTFGQTTYLPPRFVHKGLRQ